MKRLIERWDQLPLLWQLVTIPILFPAVVLWAYPEFHVFSAVIALVLIVMSSTGCIEWLSYSQFTSSVLLPYVVLFCLGMSAPLFVLVEEIKNIQK